MSIARQHAEWLWLVPVSGPFLSLPVLLEAFPRRLFAKTLADGDSDSGLRSVSLFGSGSLREVWQAHRSVDDSRGVLQLHAGTRRHFFAAAAEAMRRILIERARHKRSLKRGGDHKRVDLTDIEPAILPLACDDILGLDEGSTEAGEASPT